MASTNALTALHPPTAAHPSALALPAGARDEVRATAADRSPAAAPDPRRRAESSSPLLFVRMGARLCALPLENVVETMRPQPVTPLDAMPPFVLGLAIIRGEALPVVHGGRLVGATETVEVTRFVTLRLGVRRAAIAVDAVVGVRSLPVDSLAKLPPLLAPGDGTVVTAIGRLDRELLLVLEGAKLAPEAQGGQAESGSPDR